MEQEETWPAWTIEADALAAKVLVSLNRNDQQQAQSDFAELMKRISQWFSQRLDKEGVPHQERDDLIGVIKLRIWASFLKWHEAGISNPVILPYFKKLVANIAIDHWRRENSHLRNIKSNLLTIITTDGTSCSKWEVDGTTYVGRLQWKNRTTPVSESLQPWHRERVRLDFQDALAEQKDRRPIIMIGLLLEVLFRNYPHPIPLETVYDVALVNIAALLPKKVVSLDDERNNIPVISPEVDPLKHLSQAQMVQNTRQAISQMTPREQVIILLALDNETLVVYFAPDDPAQMLTPIFVEAFEITPQAAQQLADRYVLKAPIPDMEVASLMHITKNNLQVIRTRAREKLKELKRRMQDFDTT